MRDDLIIRREAPADAREVLDLIDAAFEASERAARAVEVDLVEHLRADGDVIDELTFVAEVDGALVGQVMCSRGSMGDRPAVGLGPIAVRPDLQRQGIGAALMASVLATAEQQGEPVIVLLGDPDYYGHFGFVPAAGLGIGSPGPWGERYFQARPLRAWRADLAGPFRYAAAFDRV